MGGGHISENKTLYKFVNRTQACKHRALDMHGMVRRMLHHTPCVYVLYILGQTLHCLTATSNNLHAIRTPNLDSDNTILDSGTLRSHAHVCRPVETKLSMSS